MIPQAPMGSCVPVVTQVVLVKIDGSWNETRYHDSRESRGKVNNQNAFYITFKNKIRIHKKINKLMSKKVYTPFIKYREDLYRIGIILFIFLKLDSVLP